MGPPVKLVIDGEAVFLCCNGCKDKALANPKETLAKVQALKEKNAAQSNTPQNNTKAVPVEEGPMKSAASPEEDAEISANLAQLSPEDRKLAEAQRICPVTENRLGSMGPPVKVALEGQPVFLCCDGCRTKRPKTQKL
jgi:hypothetical protein